MEILRKIAYFCCFGTTTPYIDEDDDLILAHRPVPTTPITAFPHSKNKITHKFDNCESKSLFPITLSPMCQTEDEIMGIPVEQLDI